MKYVKLLIGLFLVVAAVVFIRTAYKEKFIPIAPSKTGDHKQVTPSGNVILY
jgi:hypothetical protein